MMPFLVLIFFDFVGLSCSTRQSQDPFAAVCKNRGEKIVRAVYSRRSLLPLLM
jgi:hypothetical protein